jgi:hypothetical protein
MSVGPIVSVLTKIPWAKIAVATPIIIEGVKQFNEMIRGWFDREKPKKLEDRINEIENFEKEQAKLVSNIGLQIENITTAVQVMSKRVNYFIVLSLLAFLLGAISFVLVLVR